MTLAWKIILPGHPIMLPSRDDVPWAHGLMGPCAHESMGPWAHGPMDPRARGGGTHRCGDIPCRQHVEHDYPYRGGFQVMPDFDVQLHMCGCSRFGRSTWHF